MLTVWGFLISETVYIFYLLDLSIQYVDMSLLYLDTIAFWQFRIQHKCTFPTQRSPLREEGHSH